MERFVLSPHGTGWLTEMLSPFQRIRDHFSSTTGLSWFSLTSSSLSLSGAAASFIFPMRLRFCRFYPSNRNYLGLRILHTQMYLSSRMHLDLLFLNLNIHTQTWTPTLIYLLTVACIEKRLPKKRHTWGLFIPPKQGCINESPKGAKCHRKCKEPTWTTMAYRKWSSKLW